MVRFAHCPRCGGEWVCRHGLGAAVAAATPSVVPKAGTSAVGRTLRPSDLEVVYRRCPVCRERMNRRQFLPGSGVIIDECLRDGVWLDAEERKRILEHVSSGTASVIGRRLEEERRKTVSRDSRTPSEPDSSGMLEDSWLPGPLELFDLHPLDLGARFVARLVRCLLD